jgi:hypothetical protein
MAGQASDIAMIYSPGLDQALFLAGLFQRHRAEVRRVGVLLPGESPPYAGRRFHSMIPLGQADASSARLDGIPTGGRSTRLFLEQGDLHISDISMSAASLRFFDKVWSLERAAAAGIPVPKTGRVPEDVGRYPVFFKGAVEDGAAARGVASHPEDFPDLAPGQFLFQEVIQGRGTYGVGFLASNGELLAHFIHFETESSPRTGGSAIVVERFEDDRLLDHARSLLALTGYSGWGLIEFKFCPVRNDYVFMELNAKFWASCEFAFRSEPAFARRLFGIEMHDKPLDRMIFPARAFSRGLETLPVVMTGLQPRTMVRLYPGWHAQLGARLLPARVRGWARKLRRRGGLAGT